MTIKASSESKISLFQSFREEIAIFFGSLLFLFLFTAKQYPNDTLYYMIAIRDSGSMFHKHHLLFNYIGSVIFNTAKHLGYGGDVLPLMGLLNNVCGAFTIVLLFRFLKILNVNRGINIGILLSVIFSYRFWFNTGNPEVYMTTILLQMLIVFLLRTAINSAKMYWYIAIALLSALAVLFHITGVLFFGAVIVMIVFSNAAIREKITFVGVYGILTPLVTLGSYLYVWGLVGGGGGFKGMYQWIMSNASDGRWGVWHLSNFKTALKASYHVVLGGGGESHFVGSLLRGSFDFKSIYLSVVFFGVLVCGLFLLKAMFSSLKTVTRERAQELTPYICWVVGYWIFFAWWDPGESDLFTFLVVPAAITVGLVLNYAEDIHKAARYCIGMAVLLFLFNFVPFMVPVTRAENNADLQTARFIARNGSSGDLVVSLGLTYYTESIHYGYFVPFEVRSYPISEILRNNGNDITGMYAGMRAMISKSFAEKKRVFLDDKVLHPSLAQKRDFQGRHSGFNAGELGDFFKIYQLTPVSTNRERTILYEITPRGVQPENS